MEGAEQWVTRTVVGGHATVGRLSNNVFWSFQAIGKIFEKQSLNGHATVVGGHATVGRLSNNVFWTFQAIGKIFEKSHWTVTRQWSEVTRPSADCQSTFFGRFKPFGNFEKSRWTVTRQWSEVTPTVGRLSKTFFGRFKQSGEILKKVAERSRDSGRRSRDRRPTVNQRFLDVSSNWEIFWKKSLNGHATVVGGHATVGRLSINVFWTFQAIWKIFEKSHWTITRQWSEITRPSADCQTTFFVRIKSLGEILKKVAERSRDSGRRSRDRRLTVEHIYAWIREREGESISVRLHPGTAMLCRWPFYQPASPLKLALTRVGYRQGQLVYEYCKSSHWQVEFMLCDLYL